MQYVNNVKDKIDARNVKMNGMFRNPADEHYYNVRICDVRHTHIKKCGKCNGVMLKTGDVDINWPWAFGMKCADCGDTYNEIAWVEARVSCRICSKTHFVLATVKNESSDLSKPMDIEAYCTHCKKVIHVDTWGYFKDIVHLPPEKLIG